MPDLIPLNRVVVLVKLPRPEVLELLKNNTFPLPTKGWNGSIMWHTAEVEAWKKP